ncbi:hypothetical protein BurJ1DRAFT_3425 [Burkholderiales bacterium JOSHI_001]|nr:hypothetical protein BurJ1DRAFT_3425 [Burkholderiales bacterium JOSHI_001]
MGSITSWVRLEPRCRDDELGQAVQARIHDPLWMLARQWQMAEFQGEDAGSPVRARWRGDSAPVTRYFPGAAPANTRVSAARYDAAALPLEALVERQALPGEGQQGSLRLAVDSGMHLLRLLDAQPLSRSYRADFLKQFALAPPTDAQRAACDAETLSYWNLMAHRALDARRALAALRNAAGQRLPLPAGLPIAAADKAELEAVVNQWLVLQDALFTRPQAGTAPAWNPERLEYAFSIAAAPAGEEVALTAAQFAQGHLDWHSVDHDPEIKLGAAADQASRPLVRTVMPAPVSFRGAPAQRFWEMEDSAIDYGLLPAGPGDLPHLMLSEFASGFGNEWYVIPIDLDVGTLTRTRSLVVTDNFGVQTLVPPVNGAGRGAGGWCMFELSGTDRPGTPALAPRGNLLFLAPALLKTLDSRPLEEVLFLRDEMANLAWAVEHVVQGGIENRLQPGAVPDAPQAELAPPSAVPRYRLASEVPPHWTPLLPQRVGTPPSLRLVRAALLAPDGSNLRRRAQGELLNASAELKLFNEEVPREGAKVTRQFERTRWLNGSTLLWVGLRKQVGRGEGSSVLRFDNLDAGPDK